MQKIVTIAERKARALRTRRDAIAAAIEDLRAYASEKAGRFLIFGSAATGHVSEHSDLDVMIDFPDELERDAWRFVDEACSDRGIPVDIHSVQTSTDAFLRRIGPHSFVLG